MRFTMKVVVAFLAAALVACNAGTTSEAPVTVPPTTTAPVTTPHFTVTLSVSGEGQITPAGPVSVDQGQRQTFTLAPGLGRYVKAVSGCGGTGLDTTNTRFETAAIDHDCAVTALFDVSLPNQAGAPLLDTRSVVPAQTVEAEDPLVTSTLTNIGKANFTGLVTAAVELDGAWVPIQTLRFDAAPLMSGKTYAASFSGPLPLRPGSYPTKLFFSLGSTLPLKNVNIPGWNAFGPTVHWTVVAKPAPVQPPVTQTFTVTPVVVGPGSTVPGGAFRVVEGATSTITILPEPGYVVSSVSGCGGASLDPGNTQFQTAPVHADCSVTVVMGRPVTPATYKLVLNSLTAPPITHGQPVTISADIGNTGLGSFAGRIVAAIDVNRDGSVWAIVSGYTAPLAAARHVALNFVSRDPLLFGEYKVQLFSSDLGAADSQNAASPGWSPLGGAATLQITLPPAPTGFLNSRSVSNNGLHTLAIRSDGSVWSWGYNPYGQLLDGSNLNSSRPQQVLSGAVSVSAGGNYSLVLKRDGTLWSAGRSTFGELGYSSSYTGGQVPNLMMSDVVGVAAGYAHSFAVKSDGTLWAWGLNHFSQLGDGGMTDRLRPVQILTGVVAVGSGSNHGVALKADRSVWAWGDNHTGEVGDGTTVARTTPVQVLDQVVDIGAGQGHTLALKADGTLWDWGYNSSGQLGDGSTVTRLTPVQVMSGVKRFSAGQLHTLVLKTDGTLWAFGSNSSGQLGTGSTAGSTVPVQVMSDVVSTFSGNNSSSSFAVKSDGTLWAWGDNNVGQLGDGTVETRRSPVQIMGDLRLP